MLNLYMLVIPAEITLNIRAESREVAEAIAREDLDTGFTIFLADTAGPPVCDGAPKDSTVRQWVDRKAHVYPDAPIKVLEVL